MRRRFGSLIPVVLLAAVAPTAAAAPEQPDISALARNLTRAVLTPEAMRGPACSIEIASPTGRDALETCGNGSSPAPAGGSGDAVALEVRDEVNTPRWFADLEPMSEGNLARVHGYGDVAAHRPDGESLWIRSASSFFGDWGLEQWVVPFVLMGSSPIDPTVPASERPFAVGDVSGDGIKDVAVAHWLRLRIPGGQTRRNQAMVTVLDGRDGRTLWFRSFPGYVTQLLFDGNVLVIGNETGNVKGIVETNGENGSTTNIGAWRFAQSEGSLDAEETWNHSTDLQWARVLSLEPLGTGRFAFSIATRAPGVSGNAGVVVIAETSSGTLRQIPIVGFPRTLRHDPIRDLLLVHEQADPFLSTDGRQDYWITAFAAGTGEMTARLSRPGAVLVSFEVANVAGGAEPEWITGDLELLAATPGGAFSATYPAARVIAADGGTGTASWTHEVRMPEEYLEGRGGGVASWPVPYGIEVASAADGPRVVVGTLHGFGEGLRALRGSDGTVAWERFGDLAFPLFLAPGTAFGQPAVWGVSSGKVLRAFKVADGSPAPTVPLLADVYAVEAADVDGDGTADLLVGGESGAVFALDGERLGDDPRVLWRISVGAGVRKLELAQLDADPGLELVVAATDAIAAIEPGDGRLKWHRRLPDYVWTFAVGQLDGQAGVDVVVPTTTLDAFRGPNGIPLWSYTPTPTAESDVPMPEVDIYFSTPVVTPDGRVVASFLVYPPGNLLAPRHHRGLIGLSAATGQRQWLVPQVDKFGIVRLWRSTVAIGPTEDGAATQVAMTWDVKDNPTGVLGFWRPRTEVVDSRNGTVLWGVGPLTTDIVPMGTVFDPDHGLVQLNWHNATRLEPGKGTQMEFQSANADAAWADFGERGQRFVRAWSALYTYPAGVLQGPEGPAPAPEAVYDATMAGRILVQDLDSDGSDEIITTTFDWPAYAIVASYSGTGVGHGDTLPHGVAVLTAGSS